MTTSTKESIIKLTNELKDNRENVCELEIDVAVHVNKLQHEATYDTANDKKKKENQC